MPNDSPQIQPVELPTIEKLYKENHWFVESVIFRQLPQHLRNEDTVLELAQDVWTTLIEHLERFTEQVKNGIPIRATLFALARNRASGYRKAEKSERNHVSSIEESAGVWTADLGVRSPFDCPAPKSAPFDSGDERLNTEELEEIAQETITPEERSFMEFYIRGELQLTNQNKYLMTRLRKRLRQAAGLDPDHQTSAHLMKHKKPDYAPDKGICYKPKRKRWIVKLGNKHVATCRTYEEALQKRAEAIAAAKEKNNEG